MHECDQKLEQVVYLPHVVYLPVKLVSWEL